VKGHHKDSMRKLLVLLNGELNAGYMPFLASVCAEHCSSHEVLTLASKASLQHIRCKDMIAIPREIKRCTCKAHGCRVLYHGRHSLLVACAHAHHCA
jgi:RNase P subunit RPR2